MKAMAWLIGLFFGVAVHAAPQPGLMVEYSVDTDGDRIADTYVCEDQAGLWPAGAGEAVRVLDRGFYAKYPHGSAPCAEIGPWDWWQADYSGLFRFTLGATRVPPSDPVDFVIDINDGVRFALFDLESEEEICAIDFWKDVPGGWNYHSTDANGIQDVCTQNLVPDKLYGFELSAYHQSDMGEGNPIHNRAWLDFMVWNLGAAGKAEFLHDELEPEPELTVHGIRVRVRERRGETFVGAKLRLHSTMPVGEDFIRDTLIECIER